MHMYLIVRLALMRDIELIAQDLQAVLGNWLNLESLLDNLSLIRSVFKPPRTSWRREI